VTADTVPGNCPAQDGTTGWVASQAKILEESIDTGLFATRAAPRTDVAEVDARLFRDRVQQTMWAIHGRCGGLRLSDGSQWPAHSVEDHRPTAEDVVRLLFPPAAIAA
jgi:hypothetical protein